MKTELIIISAVLVLASVIVQPSYQKTDCMVKRQAALRLVQQQDKNQSLNLAIVVPNCNDDGTYATLQCHHNSNFCQCWDKEGLPMTQPKKNLKKCSCYLDRAKALKTVSPSQTDIIEVTNCANDGSYTPKQCDRQACWCVDPETGAKIGNENKDKSRVRC